MKLTNGKKYRFLLLLHFLIIPCSIMLFARLIWGTDLYALLGLIASLAWIYMYGATTVKEEILLRKEDDEKKLKTLSGEQNRLNNYKTLPEEYRMNNKKGWMLHLKLWLHCLIIPSLLFIISLELWYPESIVFLGLFLGLAWMYFFGGQMAKKIIELKKLQ